MDRWTDRQIGNAFISEGKLLHPLTKHVKKTQVNLLILNEHRSDPSTTFINNNWTSFCKQT